MQERRASPRIRLRHRVGIRLTSGEVVYVWTYDLSLGGMQLLSDMAADVGAMLPVVFSVLDPQIDDFAQVSARVRVLRSVYDGSAGCFRLGVEFTEFEADGRDAYYRFVDSRLYTRYGQHVDIPETH